MQWKHSSIFLSFNFNQSYTTKKYIYQKPHSYTYKKLSKRKKDTLVHSHKVENNLRIFFGTNHWIWWDKLHYYIAYIWLCVYAYMVDTLNCIAYHIRKSWIRCVLMLRLKKTHNYAAQNQNEWGKTDKHKTAKNFLMSARITRRFSS